MHKIKNFGFDSFIVGGYVRDYLLGKKSYDVDICTNALPKDIHKIFNINMNNYGGTNLKIGKYNIDITTFREELKYEGRNPVEVRYIDNLKDDLMRRDFTINTICMDINGKIIDYLNGIEDLNNRVIKSVGNANLKLKEDPLRILRTIRFYAVLDFSIDEELMKALKNNYYLVETLSKTKVKEELSKLFMDKHYKKALDLFEVLGINNVLNITYDNPVFTQDLIGMFAQIKIAGLPFTKEEKKNIIKITEVVHGEVIDNYTLYKYGLYICSIAGEILNYNYKKISKDYNNLPIKCRNDIAISAKELINNLGIPRNKINSLYDDLEKQILWKKIKNKPKEIIKYIKESEFSE